MKATQKKKKRKGSRKTNRSRKETQVISSPDQSITINDRDKKAKNQQVILKGEQDKKSKKVNVISEYTGRVLQFLRDARTELKKVKWPTRKELLASTVMVIFLVIVLAFFLGIIDVGLMNIIQKIAG